jgi:hypothetical protein
MYCSSSRKTNFLTRFERGDIWGTVYFQIGETSSFQGKAAWRGSLTPFVFFAAEKQKSEHGD